MKFNCLTKNERIRYLLSGHFKISTFTTLGAKHLIDWYVVKSRGRILTLQGGQYKFKTTKTAQKAMIKIKKEYRAELRRPHA